MGSLAILLLAPPALIALYRVVPPPATPLMLVRLAQGYGWPERHPVALSDISPHLARAVIAAEDNLFCRHSGVDLEALRAQLEIALDGERPRGASTVTQQTVKNLWLWPGRDPIRKLIELWIAPQADLILGKRRVLELYLNAVEWAPGVYGAQAAARHHFGKTSAELSPGEAAKLAVLLPNPLSRDPHGEATRERAKRIERRVGQLGPLLDCADVPKLGA